MDDDTKKYLAKLWEDVDAALEAAKPEEVKGAVNWGDLGVTGVELVESLDGYGHARLFYRVIIEEASPSAVELHDYIRGHLVAGGYETDIIEIVTEW